MTNFRAEIVEKVPVHVVLENMEKGMTQVFRNALKKEASDENSASSLVSEIRYYLEHESMLTTNKKYWTGTLQESIKFLEGTLEESPGFIRFKVGVDLTVRADTDKGKRNVRDYAVTVEKGLGHFPRAYAYTEQGYLKWKNGLNQRLAKALSQIIKTQWGYRDIATGQFARAPK